MCRQNEIVGMTTMMMSMIAEAAVVEGIMMTVTMIAMMIGITDDDVAHLQWHLRWLRPQWEDQVKREWHRHRHRHSHNHSHSHTEYEHLFL
jgi:hypothetical protein